MAKISLFEFQRLERSLQWVALLSIMVVLSATVMVPPVRAAADEFSFLVISDMPYTDGQNETLTETIIPAMHRSALPFVIHLGDFKGGGIACTDELMKERRDQIYSMHPDRVFYTPGDNDWTDCDRDVPGGRFSELERLTLLRELFYKNPPVLPAAWFFSQQTRYPENMRWTYGNVVFSTLHIVGTNNGRNQILLDDVDLALARVDARDRANISWMQQAFDMARQRDAAAVVFAIQADVTQYSRREECTHELRQDCNGFAAFNRNLRQLAAEFGRPVLLMHGDTRPFCLDTEFGQADAPNLWRFDSSGDYAYIDAIKVTFDPRSPTTPFTFTSLVQGYEPEIGCN